MDLSSFLRSYFPLPENMFRRLSYGGSWVFGGQVLASILGLVVNGLIARLLIPEEVGAYFLTLSLVSVSALLAQMGLNQSIVRLVAESMGTQNPGRAKKAVYRSLTLCTLAALIVIFVLGFGAGHWLAKNVFKSPIIESLIGLAGIWVVIAAFQNLLAETFRGFHDIRAATLFGGLLTTTISAILFASLWVFQGHSDVSQIVILSLVSGGTSALIAFFFLHRKVKGLEGGGEISFSEVLAITWPLLLSNLAVFVLTQADLWIIGAFRSQQEVAVYGAVTRLAVLVAMPLMIMNSVISPFIAEMYAQGKKNDLEILLRTAATIAGIPALGAFLICFFFGGPVLELVFGQFYREGALVLIVLAFGQVISVWTGSCGLTLIMTGHQTTLMGLTLVSGSIAVIGALFIVKAYGALGVAGVVSLTTILRNLLLLYFARLKSGVWTHFRFKIPETKQITNR